MMDVMDSCDVLLLPSLSEGMPTVVLEAKQEDFMSSQQMWVLSLKLKTIWFSLTIRWNWQKK